MVEHSPKILVREQKATTTIRRNTTRWGTADLEMKVPSALKQELSVVAFSRCEDLGGGEDSPIPRLRFFFFF